MALTKVGVELLEGITASTAELNLLDGVTSTTAELNILDGVTATAVELNYTEGVTSNIQTQIDNIDSAVFVGDIAVPPSQFTSALAGSGTVSSEGSGLYINSGTTAGSTSIQNQIATSLFRGVGQANFRYSSDYSLEFWVSSISSNTTNGKAWYMITGTGVAADPTTAAVGFRVDQLALKGLSVTSGGSVTALDLSTSLSAGVLTHLVVTRVGSTMTWYVDGVSKGSITSGLAGGDSVGRLVLSTTNGIDTANNYAGLYRFRFRTVQ